MSDILSLTTELYLIHRMLLVLPPTIQYTDVAGYAPKMSQRAVWIRSQDLRLKLSANPRHQETAMTPSSTLNQTLGFSFETQDLCSLRFTTNRVVPDFPPARRSASKHYR
ncbi:uncharacterized protein LOC108152178 [Drosophila miranda]|uniref:uncharacterized protein LOC108152178 n=1 Tax=Drosophila miranda TaxID=7229 RepID=UPI0007E6651C|nr:uncharacterized protein LOC108152178 [Drosophila miranda]